MFASTKIRLRPLLIALIILSLAHCGKAAVAEEVYEQWKMEMPGFVEPPMEFMIGWNVNEIPSNVTIYYDLDGDNMPEIVFAHPIIAMNNSPKCNGGYREEEEYHTLLSTCPAEHAVDYFVTTGYSMFRLLKERVWSRIFRMVTQDGRHVERCEGNRSEGQSFAPRTIGAMRRQGFIPKCSSAANDYLRAYRR